MNKLNFYLLLVLVANAVLFNACTNHQSQQKPPPNSYGVVNPDSKDAEADTLCFEHSEGLLHKDVTTVSLYINKGDIGGQMVYAPAGKYSRVGTLAGNKKDSLISTQWISTQHGQQDTLKITFKLMGEKLYQQPFVNNPKNGKQATDTTANWSVSYNKVTCVPQQP